MSEKNERLSSPIKPKQVDKNGYYVFELTKRGKARKRLNDSPFTRREAQDLARLQAKCGVRDHAVTTDPSKKTSFDIVSVYEGGTGKRLELER